RAHDGAGPPVGGKRPLDDAGGRGAGKSRAGCGSAAIVATRPRPPAGPFNAAAVGCARGGHGACYGEVTARDWSSGADGSGNKIVRSAAAESKRRDQVAGSGGPGPL